MRWFATGAAVATVLTLCAYRFHPDPTGVVPLLCLVLFPPSLGFMAAEHATSLQRVVIAIIAVAANGALYGFVALMARKMF
jgi:hypothetical protein